MAKSTVSGVTVAQIVLSAPRRSVLALGGISGAALRHLLDHVDVTCDSPRALLVRIAPASTTEAIVEQFIGVLSMTAQRLWPIWFTDVNFLECRNDTLGCLAASAIARHAVERIPGLSLSWVEAAVGLALEDRAPRVQGAHPATELAQLSLATSRSGLVLVADMEEVRAAVNSTFAVLALEWIARYAHGAVVALFPDLPPNAPPFDRILYGARRIAVDTGETIDGGAPLVPARADEPWLVPWLGTPHPLSETEQRLAKALSTDAELASLFGYNQFVDTVRGSRPKVDLMWTEGRLIVELDGYGSHGNRMAFMYDRHRDYELILSGFTVLRLSNDEIAQDIEKAIEKIRDIVHVCRNRVQ
jgi:very-short-patch-repair endonuclease